MSNFNLFVMDDTEAFASRLNSRFKAMDAAISVFWAPDAESLNELSVNYTAHAFIISAKWQEENERVNTGKALCFTLGETRQEGMEYDFARSDSVAKIASRLVRLIVGNTRVIGVFGAGGGAGNTTMCMGLARTLAEKGKRVFLLSLEACMADSPFAEPGKVGLGEVLLALDNGEDVQETIARACCAQTYSNIDTFSISEYNADRVELQKGDVRQILETMKKMNRWDVILVDLENRMGDSLFEVWEQSDRMVLLVPQTRISLEKLRNVERDLLMRQTRGEADLTKLVPVVNFASGEIPPEFTVLGKKISLSVCDLNTLRKNGVRDMSSEQMCAGFGHPVLQKQILPVLREVWVE